MIISVAYIKSFVVAILFLALLGDSATAQSEKPVSLSYIELIANPAIYDKKLVTVRGYLHLKFEDYTLYFSKEHGDYLIDGINLTSSANHDLAKDAAVLDSKYVEITGIFKNVSANWSHRIVRMEVQEVRALRKWRK